MSATNMEIPTNIARSINPNIESPINVSCIYTFRDDFSSEDGNGNDFILKKYSLPYADSVYWTQFRYAWNNLSDLNVDLCLKNSNGSVHTFDLGRKRQNLWHNLPLPIPSVKFSPRNCEIYLKLHVPQVHITTERVYIRVKIIGFQNLLTCNNENDGHDSHVYALMDNNQDVSTILYPDNNLNYNITSNPSDIIDISHACNSENLIKVYPMSHYFGEEDEVSDSE